MAITTEPILTDEQGTPPGTGEDVQLAMNIGAIVRKAGRRKKIERETIDPDAAVQEYKGGVLIKEATPEQMAVFEVALPRLGGKPGATGVKYFELNLDQLRDVLGGDLAAFQSKIIELNRTAIDQAKRGKMSLDDIKDGADRIGLTEMAVRLIGRKTGEALPNAEEMYRALVVQISTLMSARHAYQDLIEQGTEEAASRFLVAITLQGAVTTSLVGAKAETARMMAVLRNFGRVAEGNLGPTLEDIGRVFGDIEDVMGLGSSARIVEAMGGVDEVIIRGRQYMALRPAQQALVNRSAWRWVGKGMDAFIESFLMGILSGSVTHTVNMVSTAINMIYQIPVHMTATGVGAVREAITGGTGRMTMDQATIAPIAWLHAFRDGLSAASEAFLKEGSGSAGSKLDYKHQRAISAEALELDPNNLPGRAVDMLGKLVRLPGRFLVMEDEFFKALAVREELYRQALGRGLEVRRAGGSKADVERVVAQTIGDPDRFAMEAAEDYARYVTFQTPIEGGFLGLVQELTNHPLGKIFVPFFRTPTNIIKQISANSPAAILMPSFYKAIKAGGRQADTAIARLMLGSTIFATFTAASMGVYGDGVMITGYGPTDRKAREHWLDQGFRPYSFAVKQDSGLYKSISYSRFDPISGILAMAADTGWHLRHSNSDADEIVLRGLASIWNYTRELPMLQGIFDITKIFHGGAYQDPMKFIPKMLEQVTAQVGRAATVAVPGLLGPASPTGSLAATLERYMDPTKRSTKFPEDMPAWARYHPYFGGGMRNLYEVMQKARSRVPMWSEGLLPHTDRWNIPLTEGNGQLYELVSPIRIKETRHSMIEDELNALGVGLHKPSDRIEGIELSSEQYYRVKEIANTMTDREDRNLMGALAGAIEEYREQEAKGELLLPGDKIKLLRSIDDKFFSVAKKQLLTEYPEFNEAVMNRRAVISATGQAP
jgi:hypothetical protein